MFNVFGYAVAPWIEQFPDALPSNDKRTFSITITWFLVKCFGEACAMKFSNYNVDIFIVLSALDKFFQGSTK